jgi:hypothetical protein
MQTLDYALMQAIGACGPVKQKTLQRVALQSGYDIAEPYGEHYHVLLIINEMRQITKGCEVSVVKRIMVGIESFTDTGRWCAMYPQGWPEMSCGALEPPWALCDYTTQDHCLEGAYSKEEVAKARDILTRYVQRDADKKTLAIIGSHNLNIRNPEEDCYELSHFDYQSSTLAEQAHARFAHRGVTVYKEGVQLLKAGAPTITIEDYQESPDMLAEEALMFFHAMSKSIIVPREICNEIGL